MAKDLTDLAGTDPVPLRLLELAELFNDTATTEGRFLESCTAVTDALIAVGRKGQTAAHGDWYVLAEEVARWHELDEAPQRPGIDHDLYRVDTDVLDALFKLIHNAYPCATVLHSRRTVTVGDLHPTSPGWLSCGCEHAAVAS